MASEKSGHGSVHRQNECEITDWGEAVKQWFTIAGS